jgi:DNA invertase Pin-like site-specific DNA recombinase
MSQTAKPGSRRVYSYIRFSSREQALGDSERRQLEAAEAWCRRKGFLLDETVRTDRGKSGYHGTHRTKGHLGRFLALVEAGEIPSGSILLVENIDRLSRESPVKVLRDIMFKLWDRGITLQTLSPEETYEQGCENDPKFVVLVLYMQRARDESERKSARVRAAMEAARKEAREEKAIVSTRLPAWIDRKVAKKQRRLQLHAGAEETLRLLFELKLRGLSVRAIERKLNAEAPWSPAIGQRAGGWRVSYIKRVLKSVAVVGQYQPYAMRDGKPVPAGDPIPDYFPRAIDDNLFHAVQLRMEQNRGKGGRVDKARSLLTHLAKCAYCGGPMAFVQCGPAARHSLYLLCDTGRRGVKDPATGQRKCARHSIRYDEVEDLVLSNCHKLRPEQVLPDPDEQAARCEALRQRLRGREAELTAVERQVNNLIDQIADTGDRELRGRFEAKARELNARKAELEEQQAKDGRALHDGERAMQSFARWKRDLAALRKALETGDVTVRLRLRAHLQEIIGRIDVFAVGHRERYDPDNPPPKPERRPGESKMGYWARCQPQGETWALGAFDEALEHAPEVARDPEFREFLEYVTQRRMSREGRFLRVHFKTGAIVNLVPEGSLANGYVLEGTEAGRAVWDVVTPGYDELWTEFQAGKG